MLSEAGVVAILEASITGAGLILAVYALLTPLSSKIFRRRASQLKSKIKEFEETKNNLSPESKSSANEIKKLKNLQEEIEQFRIMPPYFRMEYILVPLFLYFLSVIFALCYLENFGSTSSAIYDFFVFWTFGVASATFFVIGLTAIIGAYLVMKEDFERIKGKQKEISEEKK